MNICLSIKRKACVVFAVTALLCTFLCVFLSREHKASDAASGYTQLTGGNVHVEWNSTTEDARYKDLAPTDLDNYASRVYIEIDNYNGAVNGCDNGTAYTRSSRVALHYYFTKNNDGIDKSWISTRNHRMTLYDANDKAVEPVAADGNSVNDANCYLSMLFDLPNGTYKLEAYFWQGHGVHSTQFQNRFYYTQYLVVDTVAPTVSRSAEYAQASAYATFSDGSPVTAVYTLNGGAPLPYSQKQELTAEGKYVVTATDAAGNTSSTSFTVDRTSPTISRSAEYAQASAYATFADALSPVTAVYTLNGGAPLPYSSAQDLTAEGRYVVTATDAAGNTASTSFTVDRTPPALSLSAEIARSCVEAYAPAADANCSPVTLAYSLDGVYRGELRSGQTLTEEGRYVFTATDAAGNVSSAAAVVDRTAPVIRFSANGADVAGYTSAYCYAECDDGLSGIADVFLYDNGRYVPYDRAPRSDNGLYRFRAVDRAGNTAEAELVVYRTDTFGNLAAIRDGYKLNAWYVVTLPARIFTTPNKDAAGRYSFESYDAALEFAVAKEREFRVTPVQGGYMYVSASNESVSQKYETESGLLAAVQKYAKGYVSSRQTSSVTGNDRYYTEPVSLTRNSPILPDFLLDLKNLPRMYARPSATWSLPSVAYISEMPYTVTARYLGDFAEDSTQKEFEVARGTALKDLDGYRQGWYLIQERDGAGNVESYLIYSDAELPTARVSAAFGDGEREVVLDHDYTRNETLYFLSLEFSALLDNADQYITLKLEKGNTTKYFTQSDVLPVLGSDDYTSGKYKVTVYDRSLNALMFDVYIAGNAPTMTHGSLAADRPECRISFVTSDRYNVITSIELYKIEYDGSKTALETDGAGVPVNAATLSYTLTVGGKYGATVTDNYRRTVEFTPIFFLKGLPSGRLSGVKDGGRTNRNVSFTFDSSDVCEFFTLHPNGERRPFTGYSVQTGATDTTYNVAAGVNTSHDYLVFLHNAEDRSLFVEYTFEIDTILPEFEITDGDGNVVEPDGATNKPFSIKWSETGVSVRYYTARGGSLSASRYNMNAVLSQGTLYYFTLRDDVGNELEFTVLLDNAVDYTIGGKYNNVDGVIYANAPLSFTVNEPTAVFDVVNVDGFTVDNGGTLTQAGRYEITVTDNYRNTVTLVIVLDFTPPTLSLTGAENGGAVKNDVKIIAEGYDRLYLADRLGNKIRDVVSGATFSAAGSYTVVAIDHAGNTVAVTFSIDLSVDYSLSVPNGAVTTSTVILDTAEPVTVNVTKNGERIETPAKFTECGTYEITLVDAIGNSVVCVFVIVPKRVRTLDVALPFGTGILSATKDGATFELGRDRLALDVSGAYAVVLDCGGATFELVLEVDNTPPEVTLTKDGKAVTLAGVDKDDVTLFLTLDGEDIGCSIGKSFDEPGHYVLTVTDALGNIATVEWDIPFRLNTWAIVAIVVGAVALVVVLVLIIRARRRPRLK